MYLWFNPWLYKIVCPFSVGISGYGIHKYFILIGMFLVVFITFVEFVFTNAVDAEDLLKRLCSFYCNAVFPRVVT